MMWIEFLISSALIVFIAIQLAKYGDVIAVRTKLGGMFIGVLLLASATSLPEVLTSINALDQGIPDLAAGNLMGSNMFNMFILAVLDFASQQERFLRKSALKHALSGSLAVFMIGLIVFFIIARIPTRIGWVGLDSLVIIAAYIVALWLIQTSASASTAAQDEEHPDNYPTLWTGFFGFAIAAAGLVVVTPWMVRVSSLIAETTGLGATFVGSSLVAIVTSLPELVTTLAALKIGANDMAIGNLFGSNMFNMFAIGLTDIFYTEGLFLSAISESFLLIGVLGLLMTGLGLIGNLARLEKKLFIFEVDALALLLFYFGGMWFLYLRGLTP